MNRLIFFCVFLALFTSVKAQNRMSSSEIAYLYNEEHEFLIQHRVALKDDKVKVYIRFILNSGSTRRTDYRMSYDVRSSYIDEKTVNSTVKIDSSNIVDSGFRQYVYALEFEKVSTDNLLVIDVYNQARDRHFYLDIPLKLKEWMPTPFLIFEEKKDIPYFTNYITQDYPVRIVDVFSDSQTYEINGKNAVNENKVAMPPFDDTELPVATGIPQDTVYSISNGEIFRFFNSGYHTIKSLDASASHLGIMVTDEVHPYFDNFKDLMAPLIYVSSNDEFKNMIASNNSRQAFEGFVNNTISTDQRVAKDFIKYYYRRVRKSARLFSDRREGWKTDKGMIYQVFGNPAQVFRNESTELWVYPTANGGRLRFIFDILIEDGEVKYQLIRAKRYRENWMRAVTKWRSGRIIE